MKTKNKFKKIMACFTILSSFSANINAKVGSVRSEKESTKQIKKQNNSFNFKEQAPWFLSSAALVFGGFFLRNVLNKNTMEINEQNYDKEDYNKFLEESNNNIPIEKQNIDNKLAKAKKELDDRLKLLKSGKLNTFNIDGISDEQIKELISKITVLINDGTIDAYRKGNYDDKRVIVEKIAKIIQELVISKDKDKAIKEMLELDDIADNIGKDGVLDSIMELLNNMSKYIIFVDIVGIHLFNKNESNHKGLVGYFKGVLDHFIPTEGDNNNLKLAKLIKFLAKNKRKTVKELVFEFLGNKLQNDELKKVLEEKISKIDKISN